MRRRDKESCQLICRYKSERSRWEEERTSFYLFSDHFFPSFFAFFFSSSPRAPPPPCLLFVTPRRHLYRPRWYVGGLKCGEGGWGRGLEDGHLVVMVRGGEGRERGKVKEGEREGKNGKEERVIGREGEKGK